MKELVATAKTSELNYASLGNGSTSHLTMEIFRAAAGVKLNHVPFKGSPEAHAQLIGGEIPIMFDAIPARRGVKSGKLKALGIATPKRSPFLPDLPTIAERATPDSRRSAGSASRRRRGRRSRSSDAPCRDREALDEPEVKKRLSELAFIPRRHAREVRRVHQGREREVGEGGQGVRCEGRLSHCGQLVSVGVRRVNALPRSPDPGRRVRSGPRRPAAEHALGGAASARGRPQRARSSSRTNRFSGLIVTAKTSSAGGAYRDRATTKFRQTMAITMRISSIARCRPGQNRGPEAERQEYPRVVSRPAACRLLEPAVGTERCATAKFALVVPALPGQHIKDVAGRPPRPDADDPAWAGPRGTVRPDGGASLPAPPRRSRAAIR